MEPINQLSIESFSHGWLNNINPTFDFDRLEGSLRRSFEALDSSSFIEMDPEFFSMRLTESTRFDFILPASSESSNLVHADQIFSNGQLLPLSTLKKKEACFSSDTARTRSVSTDFSMTSLSERKHWHDSSPTHYSSYSMPLNGGGKKLKLPLKHRQRNNSTGKKLMKYLNFLIPLYKKVKKLKMMSLRTARSCGDSPLSSVRMKKEFANIERNRANRISNWEFESSINDAVLHCKKSIAISSEEA